MSAEAEPFAIHATAVAIGDRALLIRGPSKSGKSRLALALIAASTRRRPIRLVGDDRILLTPGPRGLVARPHPRIAGFIERRGLGIVAIPYKASARVGGLVDLGSGSTTPCRAALENFPRLPIVTCLETDARRDMVLDWWDAWNATCAPHSAPKTGRGPAEAPKN